MSLEIEGTLVKILPEQSGESQRGKWVKQEFVIEVKGEFPKMVCFSVWAEKVKDLKSFRIGDFIKVSFDVSSREFKDKWYTDLRAWKLDKKQESKSASEVPPLSEADIPPELPGEDDLPF